jgi:hypothetical protein
VEQIIASYIHAEYYINGLDEPLRVGHLNSQVEDLLDRNKAKTWCFITAWNPLSVNLSPEQNKERNSKLHAELAEYFVIEGEGRDPNGAWRPEESFLVIGIKQAAAKRLATRYGQRAIVFGEKGKPAELIGTLFTEGNCELIRLPKTAFLCSRKIPAGIVLKCYDWAIVQREAGNCVIGGFHSKIEKDVLHYLLKGTQPIIVALARSLKTNLEPEFVQPLKDGRLLIVSPFDKKIRRADKRTASIRNQLMLDLADNATIGHASPGGNLEKMLNSIPSKYRVEFI